MKRITLFFAVLLGLSVFQTALGVDSETARAASKRTSANTASSGTSTRTVGVSNKSEQKRAENARSTTKNVRTTIQPRTQNTKQQTVRKRPSTSSVPTVKKTVSSRNTSTGARTTTTSRVSTTARKAVNKQSVTRSATAQHISRSARAAELNTEKINQIKSKDYSKCRTTYFDCMDEFCANKDNSLRRCACSIRVHDFDNIKKQLTDAEDKMVGFNQRLLTVGLDKEDALAINTATEGELAFTQQDSSGSEKLLQKITKTLNESNDSKITNNLAAISLDLDMSNAWDSVDSTAGIATTSKSGLDLYNAAQPICLEMAREICQQDELEIAENSYKLAIQQDCNTVSKAYDTQYNKAMSKIHESGALLDMARLNAYQQRNYDDILTCKQKIIDKLYDASICGEKLYKCLDITGQYINPADGSAFLSADLFNITKLLTEPADADTKWSKVSGNEDFVRFLNSKKEFLESATEQCQDIADTVWKDFLDDALAQIKLAQNAKLEEIRQSCVTLIAQCKTKALTSIENFDLRATSTFSILANSTANAICSDVQNACISLIDSSGDSTWATSINNIDADTTYEALIENCTMVGQTCIMQRCSGSDSNFSLCVNTNSSTRQSILKRESCWEQVFNCVAQASNIKNISDNDSAYFSCSDSANKPACKIAHKIWGDCEQSTTEPEPAANNEIIETDGTLLNWFYTNTSSNKSCFVSPCPEGWVNNPFDPAAQYCPTQKCVKLYSLKTTDGHESTSTQPTYEADIIRPYSHITNYCTGGCTKKDSYGNCCSDSIDNGICVPNGYSAVQIQTGTCNDTQPYYCPSASDVSNHKEIYLYCVTNDTATYPKEEGGEITCGPGYWVMVDEYGNYFNPQSDGGTPIYNTPYKPAMWYQPQEFTNLTCSATYYLAETKWVWMGAPEAVCVTPTPFDDGGKNYTFKITYP